MRHWEHLHYLRHSCCCYFTNWRESGCSSFKECDFVRTSCIIKEVDVKRVVTRTTSATTESGCVTIVMPTTINSNSCYVIEQDFLTNQNS